MYDQAQLIQELASVTRPVGEARGLPSHFYTSPAAFDFERERIFRDGWAAIGFGADVPEPGDARPVEFLGMPLLLLRDRTGTLRVFENVCRHRGMILVQAPGNFGGVIRCPYHSWCYSQDGRLRATPHVGGPGINTHPSIDPAQTGLIPVRMGVFLDTIFVNISGVAEPFEEFIAPLASRWTDFADRPLFAGRDSTFTLDVACNWKLAVENYCESYHLPWVHPGLNSYSKLEDHYNIEQPGHFSGQGTRVYNPRLSPTEAFPDFADLPEYWDSAAEYVALYPNILLGVHRDHVFAIRLDPKAPGHTLENVALYYTSRAAAESDEFADLRASNARLWKDVFVEDIFVVEGMQKGRGAPGFDGGRFSAVMDSPTHMFHSWAASRLG
ncbi:aromatic ring-hydroxylating oxygenase subunit alpha [Algicella marina]|uniref:Rieske 2Fe-2S domain-containing protein n=1 Tax=Algicella marina TaxID=2683284 RepID=A0A6P1SWZ7_9RHOB|nr:aromatic ring-hydroxylating dioxygenase subunit alpha [Algicella marina]QHQ34968.1 Rieske 2Fe-2S domain-containing protein [Algicella marina]